jgi:4-carboxymuconolactone decarboxylase
MSSCPDEPAPQQVRSRRREVAVGTGDEKWREIMCSEPPSTDDGGFLELTRDHVFGTIWARGELSTRDRRLISLTCTAVNPSGPALALHVEKALQSGDLTPGQVDEWIVHLAHYAGWPVAANVYSQTRAVLAHYRDDAAANTDGA